MWAVAWARPNAYEPGVDKRRLILVAMWVAALAAIAAIYLNLEPEPLEGASTTAGDAPTYLAGEDTAPPASRASLPVAEDTPRVSAYRGGGRHTGRTPFVGPSSARRLWRTELGGRITAQPVMGADGTIYVPAHDHALHAVSPEGEPGWRAQLHQRAWAAALVLDDGDVVVGSDADAFFRLRADDGAVAWRVRTEGDADGAPAVAADGTIYFTAGPHVYAVDGDGEVQWRFQARGPFLLSSPAIDSDGTLYIGSIDDHVYAIAPDGRMRWEYETEGDISSSPVIGDDGTIFVGSDDQHVHAITRDGELRWRTHVDGYVRAPVALGRNDDVVAAIYGPQPRVVSLAARDGALRWYFPVAVSESPEIGVASGPLVDGEGNVYFGAHDDFVYALTPDGDLRWIERTGADVDSAPILREDGVLLVGCDDGFLYAIGQGEDGPDDAGAGADAGVGAEPAEEASAASEAPATDQPANEVPANEAPANDVPANDEPATEEPAVDEPVEADEGAAE